MIRQTGVREGGEERSEGRMGFHQRGEEICRWFHKIFLKIHIERFLCARHSVECGL